MHGDYYLLATLPIWATAFLLYVLVMGVLFVLRDRSEGLFYNTSYSAMLGDGALVVVALMAAGILQRGVLLPAWVLVWDVWFHTSAIIVGITLGVTWLMLDRPKHWGDRYHHMVIAPLLCYLGVTLLPVIVINGTKSEVATTTCLILLWAGLVVYDAVTKRLDQRNYYNIGEHLDYIKLMKSMKK